VAKTRDSRIELINNIKKGKLSDLDACGRIKYRIDQTTREYIFNKLPKKSQDLIYNTPFPKDYSFVCGYEAILSSPPSLYHELLWYYDIILQFSANIEKFNELKKELEIYILKSRPDLAWKKLDIIEKQVSVSYYGLMSELYLNEMVGDTEINKEIIGEFLEVKGLNVKFLILAESARIRIEKNLSAWQYDSYVQQHIMQYSSSEKNSISYIKFKLDPIHFYKIQNHYEYVIYMDSDFPLVDRYNTLKKILPSILQGAVVKDQERVNLFLYADRLSNLVEDPYWRNIDILNEYPRAIIYKPDQVYYEVQDLYFLGNYAEVVILCSNLLTNNPALSELYVFFVHSLIFEGGKLESYILPGNELHEILLLMIRLLEKTNTYNSDRENLLKKYHALSHFDFSYPILEFLYNEYWLSVPNNIYALSHLHSSGLKYNFFKLLMDPDKQLEVIKNIKSPTFDYIRTLIAGGHPVTCVSFLQQKLYVGYLIHDSKHGKALEKLCEIERVEHQAEFVETWLLRNFLKCFIELKHFDKAANYITDYYFKKKYAYDHFLESTIFEILAEMTEEFSNNISNAILFQIYNQSQSLIYDVIANFLILNNVKKPSELIAQSSKWRNDKFLYFIERCCTKDNIEDSPYLYTIEELEEERITLLNFLKESNTSGEEQYNLEILKITKEASIRKGLLQIHESRIYVDDKGISKRLETDFPELFERYIELTDISHVNISSLKLNDDTNRSDVQTTYYFKNGHDELHSNIRESDIVYVPQIRFTYFRNLFDTITYQFVFSEDYGFKSFLSMRIRHGTFSNMLRSVYEKYFLISSKEIRTDLYQDIGYWDEKLNLEGSDVKLQFQDILKIFSRAIDEEVDKGLSWLSINNSIGLFNFIFTPDEMSSIFTHRLGRIDDYDIFITEVFKVLFERLEENLSGIRLRIIDELSPKFISMLEELQVDIRALKIREGDLSLIETNILDCKTEIQVVTSHIVNWFKISKNHYIEEFPIDLILQASLDYVNNINRNAITKGRLTVANSCQVRFKGEFFETFGDVFINIFENIISKNKGLDEELAIDIKIDCNGDELEIIIVNNLLPTTNHDELDKRIKSTVKKIEAYKVNPSATSFEKGSGYLKLCKSIGADLNRSNYVITPSRCSNSYSVDIKFNIKDLTK
jgi:hypothetical protein